MAFLGGSITYNSGWRDSICAFLERTFPETAFEFVAAGIPSMGSTPGAFRLDRDVLSKGKIDLLFEEAAVNDETNGRSDLEQVRAMEGIVRHLRKSNPVADIVLMHFVDPEKMQVYNNGEIPRVIQNHERVAEHYQISSINLAQEVTARINHQEFSWEDDFKNLHPSPFGQIVYANSMIHFLENAFSKAKRSKASISAHLLPNPLDEEAYGGGYLIEAASLKAKKGWFVDHDWKPKDNTGTRANYVNVPMLISNTPGSKMSLRFSGKAVGIAVAAGQDAGQISYQIDNGPWKDLNLYTKWSGSLHLPWYYTLATGLSSKPHKLKIKIAEKSDERSQGHACRIRYFFVNRH